jgi:beta-glucanase (GH16 family)
LPSQISVNGGLTLTAIRQSVNGVNGGVATTYPFTSGYVSSYGKFEFAGGYLQISMKAPSGDGAWPSLWMLPGSSAGKVGDKYEIDLQEGGFTASGSPNANNNMAYHLHTPSGTFGGVVNTGVDVTAGYNTYGLDWEPGKSITWYLNGVQVGQITSAQAPIPTEPMEVLIGNEVANSNASGWHTVLDSSTPNSMAMQIGDVQLYQKAGGGDTLLGGNVTSGGLSTPSSGGTSTASSGGTSTASSGGTPTASSGETATAPTVTIADPSISVSPGGQVALGIGVTVPNAGDTVTVSIAGLPKYETITDNLDHKTFSGSYVSLTAAEVNSGLTLKSNYRGAGHPTATLTVAATDLTTSVASSPQTLTVVDPPAPATTVDPSGTGGRSGAASGEQAHLAASATSSRPLNSPFDINQLLNHPEFERGNASIGGAASWSAGPGRGPSAEDCLAMNARNLLLLNQLMAGSFGEARRFGESLTESSGSSRQLEQFLANATH